MEAEAGGRRIKAEKFIHLFTRIILIFKHGKVISYNRTAGEKLWLQKRLLVRASKILISIYRHLHLSLLLISAAGYLC